MTFSFTAIFVLTVTLIAVVFDIVMVFIDRQATISKLVTGLSTFYPSLAILCGIMIGHFFWPAVVDELNYWKISLPILGLVMVGVMAFDIWLGLPRVTLIIYVIVGALLGHYLWPQTAL
jgi:hypothetical protein